MNTLIVYSSKYGNTQKVAETMAGVCQDSGATRVLSLDALRPVDLQEADLVIMGSPTHRMNLPLDVRARLADLPKRCLRGKSVAVFDTSYRMSAWLNRLTASKKLGRKLKRMGGKRVVPPETFHVVEAQGPLYDGELQRATAWAGMVVQKVGC
jgi:flavodoxin